MSKFCIELENVTLPDVIAAVVEAWYEAQNVDNREEKTYYSASELEKVLSRGRATIYRLLNTCKGVANPPFDPCKINHEFRIDTTDPIRVSGDEITRWRNHRKPVTIESTTMPAENFDQSSEHPKQTAKTWLFPDDGTVSCAKDIASVVSNLISAGHFKDGEKMPSLRDLATRIGCHRNTIQKAYQEMVGMGILEAKIGSGVYVVDQARLAKRHGI